MSTAFNFSEKLGMMVVFDNRDRWDTSNVIMNGNLVEQYVKNGGVPNMNFIDAGIVMFKKSVFLNYRADAVFPLEDVYANLIQANQMAGFRTNQRFFEIGSKVGLEEIRGLCQSSTLPR
jgi:NDP-sugar pyrophosphorylase family protein